MKTTLKITYTGIRNVKRNDSLYDVNPYTQTFEMTGAEFLTLSDSEKLSLIGDTSYPDGCCGIDIAVYELIGTEEDEEGYVNADFKETCIASYTHIEQGAWENEFKMSPIFQ